MSLNVENVALNFGAERGDLGLCGGELGSVLREDTLLRYAERFLGRCI